MSGKTYPLVFLGIPLTNSSMDETNANILRFIEEYKKDLHPRYVATLNVDFLANTNQWNIDGVRFPELQRILRQAAIVATDGMPILWACRLMGSYTKERVTGADLLPKLSEVLNAHKKSVFLLGGDEKTIKLSTLYLQALYPDLVIAGSAHPQICVEGKELDRAETQDELLIEQINRSNADVLFINLGNPKQEIWFERVKPKIHTPISIGVGGAFGLLTGIFSRAPVWMQKSGLEWVYRLMQEPKRLFKRYFVDFFKFIYMVTPVLFYHNLNRLLFNLFYNEKLKLKNSILFISTHHTIALLPLPSRINGAMANEILKTLDDLLSQDVLVFDFKDVKHIDLEGIWLLFHLSQRVIKEKKPIFMLNLNGDICLLLKLHRIWDVLENSYCKTPKNVIARLGLNGASPAFYDAIQQDQHFVIISFFGKLDNNINYDDYLKKIKPVIHQKECILDFSYCYYIDNTGFQFLLNLKQLQKDYFISLKITGLSRSLKRQFENTNVYHVFK